MKFALGSDIHLEFGPIVLTNDEGADALVLAGDICVAKDLGPVDDEYNEKSQKYHKFFQGVCANFPQVIYVAGNHEHYHGDYAQTYDILKKNLAYLENLHVLDKETVTVGDTTFIGGTLWTDMNDEDPMTLHAVGGMMNDFQIIHNSNEKVTYKVPVYKYAPDGKYEYDEKGYAVKAGEEVRERDAKFTTEMSVVDHKKMVGFIKTVVEGKYDQKFVVVGHHAPSKLSTHPKYASEKLMNGAYSSDLSDLILDRPQIKCWVHGHTHEDFDYVLGGTRVVCNPRGYINYEARADQFNLKYITV